MSNKDSIDCLIEENQKLKDEIQILVVNLKKTLYKASGLISKFLELKEKIDFYESLNFVSSDEFAKGFNKAFQMMQNFINNKIEKDERIC